MSISPTECVRWRVEYEHESEWLRYGVTIAEETAREILATVRKEYPHKRARLLRVVTTEEVIDV